MTAIQPKRKSVAISQMALAARLNVTQGAISQWEKGATKPSTGNLILMAEIFGCTIDELIDRKES